MRLNFLNTPYFLCFDNNYQVEFQRHTLAVPCMHTGPYRESGASILEGQGV